MPTVNRETERNYMNGRGLVMEAESYFSTNPDLAKRKLREAISCFDSAILGDMDYMDPWEEKGDCFIKLEEFERALSAYERGLSTHKTIFSSRDSLLIKKATALSHLQRFNDAFSIFDRVLEDNPENPDALAAKGLALVLHGKNDKALRTLKVAYRLYKAQLQIIDAEKVLEKIRGLDQLSRLEPQQIALERYLDVIKKLPHITKYTSFKRIKVDELADVIREHLREKFHIINEMPQEGEHGFACSAKIGSKLCILAINILRDKQLANLAYIVFTIYSDDVRELLGLFEDLTISFSDYIERETEREEILLTPEQKQNVIVTIKDSVVYKTWIGNPQEVQRHIEDSIVSRGNV